MLPTWHDAHPLMKQPCQEMHRCYVLQAVLRQGQDVLTNLSQYAGLSMLGTLPCQAI